MKELTKGTYQRIKYMSEWIECHSIIRGKTILCLNEKIAWKIREYNLKIDRLLGRSTPSDWDIIVCTAEDISIEIE